MYYSVRPAALTELWERKRGRDLARKNSWQREREPIITQSSVEPTDQL